MDGTIGAYEAKTKLSELLDRVERGESLTITRNGKPVARLTPAELPAAPNAKLSEAEANSVVEGFRHLRASLRAQGVRPFSAEEIVDLIHAGRKY
jgi:prevent-host-death family protein